jgi:hypothetical protein
VSSPPAGGRALLVSPGNLFLEQVLASLPGVQPFRLLPDEAGAYALPAEPFDLYVLDGVFPGGLPVGAHLLLVDPPDNELFSVGAPYSDTLEARVTGHPLGAYLDWSGVSLRQARRVQLPAWGQPLVETPAGPLVFTGQTGGRRVAALLFDLRDSDLPLQVSFPVLMDGLARWLLGAQAVSLSADSVLPGEPVTIRAPAGTVTVTGPGGQAALSLEAGEAVFTGAGAPGLYRVQAGQAESLFAASLFSAAESSIQPAEDLRLGRSPLSPARPEALGQRELWPWLALLGLGVLILEWFVYHQRDRG